MFLHILFIVLGAGLAQNAQAQSFASPSENTEDAPQIINQYDPKYSKAPKPDDANKQKILNSGEFGMYFVRLPDAKSNEATLRITSPIAISGCIDITPPSLTTEIKSPYMRVMLTPAKITLDKQPRYDHTPCYRGQSQAYVDLTFNRNDLRAQKITKLIFMRDALIDRYNIHIDAEHLMLHSDKKRAFKPQTVRGKNNPLEHWFYPKNTIILEARTTSDFTSQDIYPKIKQLANAHDMIALSSVLKQFDNQLDTQTRFYFVDEAGEWAAKTNGTHKIKLGDIDLNKTVNRIDGEKKTNTTIEIFARKPNLYD